MERSIHIIHQEYLGISNTSVYTPWYVPSSNDLKKRKNRIELSEIWLEMSCPSYLPNYGPSIWRNLKPLILVSHLSQRGTPLWRWTWLINLGPRHPVSGEHDDLKNYRRVWYSNQLQTCEGFMMMLSRWNRVRQQKTCRRLTRRDTEGIVQGFLALMPSDFSRYDHSGFCVHHPW